MVATETEIIQAILDDLDKTPVREADGRVVLVREKCGNCKKFKEYKGGCERGYATYPGCEKWEYYG